MNRRAFLLSSGAVVLAANSAAFAANEIVNVGVIGVGGRARKLMETLNRIPTARITAICDVWDTALNEAKALADPKATTTKVVSETAR